MQSHIRKVYACLAVICHLHFWQNDRDLLHATAVTRGWNKYRNKSQHRKSTLERKIRLSYPRPYEHMNRVFGLIVSSVGILLWKGNEKTN